MEKTIKLYENNQYLKEAEGNIIEILKDNGDILAVLDKTIFFPQGGGQPCDKGYINDAFVSYVFEKDGVVYHKLDKYIKCEKAHMKLDFSRRQDHMQQHAGEHILSGMFLKLYGGKNKGFHLGEDYVTCDIDIQDITEDMLLNVEEAANIVIYENIDINTCLVNKAEAENLPLRKELKVESDIRIVSIEGVDMVACCGTHPKKTGEIGVIKIIKTEKYKKMTRVCFICGLRAFKEYQKSFNILRSIGRYYSSDEDNIMSKIKGEEEKNNEIYKEVKKLKEILNSIEADILLKEEGELVFKKYKDKSFEEIQEISNILIGKGKLIILSSKENRVLIAHNGSYPYNLGKIFRESINGISGKGGGGQNMAQGVFEKEEDTEIFMNIIKDYFKKLP